MAEESGLALIIAGGGFLWVLFKVGSIWLQMKTNDKLNRIGKILQQQTVVNDGLPPVPPVDKKEEKRQQEIMKLQKRMERLQNAER